MTAFSAATAFVFVSSDEDVSVSTTFEDSSVLVSVSFPISDSTDSESVVASCSSELSNDSVSGASVSSVATSSVVSCCSGNKSFELCVDSSVVDVLTVSAAAGMLIIACVTNGLPKINTEELTRIRDKSSCFVDFFITLPSFY